MSHNPLAQSVYDALRAHLVARLGSDALVQTEYLDGPASDRITQLVTTDGTIVLKLHWTTAGDRVSLRHEEWSLWINGNDHYSMSFPVEFRGRLAPLATEALQIAARLTGDDCP